MKAKKCAVIGAKGRFLMASEGKCRIFKSINKATKFVRNIVRVSNELKMKDFEFITM